jgi:hypothetical protein
MSKTQQSQKAVSLTAPMYYNADFLQEVEEEIQKKAFVVITGMDQFSKAETLAYCLLQANGYFSGGPELMDHNSSGHLTTDQPS